MIDIFKLIGSIFVRNDDANKQIDGTASKAKDMSVSIGKSMESAGKKIEGVGKALAPVSVAVGAMLGASVKGASDFTDGMAKMSTLFDTTETSVGDLSKQFLDLSNKTGISATELAEAGYQALSAGQSVDQVGGFIETAGNLAKAGFTSTTTAVDVLTTAMNAYGEEAGTADEIAQKLVRTQNLGKTTVDELASNMGKVIPTASAMGVNIDNLTSSYVSLTKQGISTAESTTYINSMLNELGDSGTTLGGVLQEKTGKSFQDLMDEGYSLADVLQVTKDYADENGIAYNELWGSAEAGKAGLSILNTGAEEFNSTLETMQSDTDDVGSALEKLETPSVKMQKSLNRVKNSGIELGTAVLTALTPAIDKVSGVIEKATDWFNGLDDKTKGIIATFGGVVTALAPVLMVGGKVLSGLSKVVPHITKLKTSIGGLSGVMGALTSPVGIVIMAIGALIGIFVALYAKNEQFRNQVNRAWMAIQIRIQGVVDAIRGFVEAGISRIQSIITVFVGVAQQIWSQFGQQIMVVVSNAFGFISTTIQVVLDVVAGIIRTVTAIINGDWSGAWNSIRQTISTIWKGIRSIITSGINLAKSVIKLGLNVIKSVWTSIWNSVKTKISEIWNSIKNIVRNAINSVRNTLSSILNSIRTTFSTIWTNIKTTVSNTFTNIKTTVSDAIGNVKETISEGLTKAKETVSGIFEDIKKAIGDKLEDAKETVGDLIEKIKSKFKFSWSLPKLKLPHIRITGSWSLKPPFSFPHFSIDWYKKAMDDPFMMTDPTVFGINPKTGSLKAGGEAGDEIVYGHQKLMEDIRNASGYDQVVQVITDWMSRLYDLLVAYLPELAKMDLYINKDALVGQIAPAIDRQLGLTVMQKRRGN